MKGTDLQEMCYQNGKDVTPQSDLTEIMGFDSSMLKLVLESFVDEVAEESAELILERPRFVHAVVIVAGEDEEFCQASCIRQLDTVEVQEPVQAAVPEDDEAIQRALRELMESREMLSTGETRYVESEPATPTKSQPLYCKHTTNDLLKELNNTNMYVRQTAVQFPSMTRTRGHV